MHTGTTNAGKPRTPARSAGSAAQAALVSWHYTVDDHEIYHHLPDDEPGYHAGDLMEADGGNMNGVGIEMCVNEDGNYEQTLVNAERLCARLREQGLELLASVPDSAALPVTEVDFSQGPCAVFIGNEGNGLSQETIAQCQRVTIPMAGRAESLNASAAATILLWEMARAGGEGASHG